MAKPATLPRWADVGGGAGGVGGDEPLSGEKDTGWVANQVPPAEYFNWLGYWTYKWCSYLDTLEAEALTFTAGVTFVGVTSTPGLSASAAAHASGVGGLFVSTSTAGSIGLKATVNNATGYAIKAETQTANGTAALITSTAGASTLTNGLSVNGVYGGAAVLASTTKAASSGTATYAVNASIAASATATTAIDAALFGWGGTGVGMGVYGLAGTTGAGYGVKGEGVSSSSVGVRGIGGAGTSGGLAGYFEGGASSTGGAGIGATIVGGSASSSGAAGAALTVQPGTTVSGSEASAIVTANVAATDATDGAYGLFLDAGHDIKFNGARTGYLYDADLPNVLTAGNIANVRASLYIGGSAYGVTAGRNLATSALSVSTVDFTLTFKGNFANTNYTVVATSGVISYGVVFKTKSVGACSFELYNTSTGALIDCVALAAGITAHKFDVVIFGEMDP